MPLHFASIYVPNNFPHRNKKFICIDAGYI